MKPQLDIDEALGRTDLVFIDVRSPEEFSRASIPDAINIPLFNDREHRELGLIYHSDGEAAARRAALTFVSPRLPSLVDEVAAAAGDNIPLLYCWRGGLRSLSLYYILNLSGLEALRLKGGYRAFRRHINRRYADFRLNSKFLVLRGLTGVGKTAVINNLIERGCPAIDLEGLARHHGSVFGAIGFAGQRSQKDFDALLLQQLERYHRQPFIVVEGEGRRIGNVHLPTFLGEAMDKGIHILLTAPLAERVRRIVCEYLPPQPTEQDLEQIRRALCSLHQRLGEAKTERLLESLSRGDYAAIAETLCTDYYDRLYGDARPERYPFLAVIDTAEISAASDKICALIRQLNKSGSNLLMKGAYARECV